MVVREGRTWARQDGQTGGGDRTLTEMTWTGEMEISKVRAVERFAKQRCRFLQRYWPSDRVTSLQEPYALRTSAQCGVTSSACE